jgi:transcriptional regulator with XRE-family HTH domain
MSLKVSKSYCKACGCAFTRVRKARLDMKWTRGDLARVAELSELTVCKIEDASLKPTVGQLMQLAQALRVTMDWLTGLSDTPNGIQEVTVNGVRFVPGSMHTVYMFGPEAKPRKTKK